MSIIPPGDGWENAPAPPSFVLPIGTTPCGANDPAPERPESSNSAPIKTAAITKEITTILLAVIDNLGYSLDFMKCRPPLLGKIPSQSHPVTLGAVLHQFSLS
jgi:hypothetical protein